MKIINLVPLLFFSFLFGINISHTAKSATPTPPTPTATPGKWGVLGGLGKWALKQGKKAVKYGVTKVEHVMASDIEVSKNKETTIRNQINSLQLELAAKGITPLKRDQNCAEIKRLGKQLTLEENRTRALQETLTKKRSEVLDFGTGLLKKATDEIFADVESARKTYEQATIEATKAAVQGDYMLRQTRERLVFLTHHAPQLVFILILIIGAYFLLSRGADLGSKYIELQFGRPTLVRESSKLSLKQAIAKKLKSIFYSDNEEENDEDVFSDIVLTPEIQDRLGIIVSALKRTKELNLTYQNLLFYGPPGTGKTALASDIAKKTGMDYAKISGEDLCQLEGGKAIIALNEIFDWAEKNKNGTILFFDEPERVFGDRTSKNSIGTLLTNAFLARTGGSSDKYMVILATNNPDKLDRAVRSRMHKQLLFGLPTQDERYKILMLKITKYIIDAVHTYKEDGDDVEVKVHMHPSLTGAYLRHVANTLTSGFSGRDLDNVVREMYMVALISNNGVLTKEIVDDVIAQKKVEVDKDNSGTVELGATTQPCNKVVN